jgi:hypothetical protein
MSSIFDDVRYKQALAARNAQRAANLDKAHPLPARKTKPVAAPEKSSRQAYREQVERQRNAWRKDQTEHQTARLPKSDILSMLRKKYPSVSESEINEIYQESLTHTRKDSAAPRILRDGEVLHPTSRTDADDIPEIVRRHFELEAAANARRSQRLDVVDVPRIVRETSLPSLTPATGPGVSSGPVRFDGSADPKLVDLARKASQESAEVKRRARERDRNAWRNPHLGRWNDP